MEHLPAPHRYKGERLGVGAGTHPFSPSRVEVELLEVAPTLWIRYFSGLQPRPAGSARKGDLVAMGEHATEDELVSLEHEWTQAILENDMEKLERIVAQEYTLAANNFPGGRTRLSRQEWMATVPVYEVHSYEFRDIVVHPYGEAAVVLANLDLQASVQGKIGAAASQ